MGAEGQKGVNACILCGFVILYARQKQNLKHNFSTPVALEQLSCLNLFGTIDLLPFCWKGKPVGVLDVLDDCSSDSICLSHNFFTVKVALHFSKRVLSQIYKLLSDPDSILNGYY